MVQRGQCDVVKNLGRLDTWRHHFVMAPFQDGHAMRHAGFHFVGGGREHGAQGVRARHVDPERVGRAQDGLERVRARVGRDREVVLKAKNKYRTS